MAPATGKPDHPMMALWTSGKFGRADSLPAVQSRRPEVLSQLSSLDHSKEDHRRMRELVALFVQEESRGELGIGAISDAFSDRLFPSVFVIQTRACYLLFVPSIFRVTEQRNFTGVQLRARGEAQERRLVEALRRGGDLTGLIGRVAGPGVKILPSTIYWTGLRTYGIARHPSTLDQAIRSLAAVSHLNEADELAERAPSRWDPTLPLARPASSSSTWTRSLSNQTRRAFWSSASSIGFSTRCTAICSYAACGRPWTRQHRGCCHPSADSLKRVARRHRTRPAVLPGHPWRGAAVQPPAWTERRSVGFDGMDDHAGHYEDQLANWWGEVACDPGIQNWDRTDFSRTVRTCNPNVTPRTIAWVDA
jgi:Family of unknown function (DUF6361)